MVGKLNRAMQRNPLLTEAMTRAYVFAEDVYKRQHPTA